MSEKSSRLGLYCVLLVVVVVVNIDLCVVCSSVCSTVSAPGGLEVNCSYRGLENVPDDLPTAGVVELALSWNSIKIIKNRTFTAFTDLLYLNLFQNPIHTVEPDAFIGLSSLRVLNLSHNRLSTWPDEPLRTLHSLKELNIYKLNLIESGPLPSGFRNITHLINFYLGWNGITNVTQDFFSNLHQESVRFLDLSLQQTSSWTIEPAAFSGFTALEELRFKYNHITGESLDALFAGFNGLPLTNIDLSYTVIGTTLTSLIFSNLPQNNVTCLSLTASPVESITDGALSNLKHLQILRLDATRIQKIQPGTFRGLERLRTLDLTDSLIDQSQFNITAWPLARLQTLYISFQQPVTRDLWTVFSGEDLPELRSLYIVNYIPIQVVVTGMGDLETLECQYCWLDLTNLTALRTLHMENWRLTYQTPDTHPWFSEMRALTTIQLISMLYDTLQPSDPIDLSDVTDTLHTLVWTDAGLTDKWPATLRGLHQLNTLDLSSNPGLSVPEDAFEDNELLRVVRLSHIPALTSLPAALSTLHLNSLDATFCGIFTFSATDVNYLRSERLSRLYAGGNPFYCSCDLQLFLDWFRTSAKIADRRDSYTCSNKHVDLDHVALYDCNHLRLLVSLPLGFVLLVSILGVVAYRYRWTLRWLHYTIKLKRYQALEEELEHDPNIEYDAFVSYSSCDYRFVINQLIPELEQTADPNDRFHIAFDIRDFVLGEPIVDNIVQHINKSRRTLILLSNNFIDSHWTMFEYEMARSKLAERRNVIIVIVLEAIGHRMKDLPKSLNELLRKKVYIEWTTDPRGQKLFWRKLRRALQKPTRIRNTET